MSANKFLTVGSDGSSLENGGTINGDLVITGDLSVSDIEINNSFSLSGDLTVNNLTVVDTAQISTLITVSELKIDDALIEIAVNNNADILNTGFIEKFNDGQNKWSGLMRSSNNGKHYLLGETNVKPTTLVNLVGESHGTLVTNTLESNTINSTSFINAESGLILGPAGSKWKLNEDQGSVSQILAYGSTGESQWIDNDIQTSFLNSSVPQIETTSTKPSVMFKKGLLGAESVITIVNDDDSVSIKLNGDGEVESEKLTIRESGVKKWSLEATVNNLVIKNNSDVTTTEYLNSGEIIHSASGSVIHSIKSAGNVEIGLPFNKYILPNAKGAINQALAISNASSGTVGWKSFIPSTTGALDNTIPRWNGSSGTALQGSNWLIGDTNAMVNPSNTAKLSIGAGSALDVLGVYNDNITSNQMAVYSSKGSPLIDFRKSGDLGTTSAPTNVLNNDHLGVFRMQGWSGSSYLTGAQFAVRSTENWSNTARGCNFIFRTTPTGTTNLVDRWILGGDGSSMICNSTGAICLTITDTGSVIIGDTVSNTTEYVLPAVRGVLPNQVLRDSGSGIMAWHTLFKADHYNYQTIDDGTTTYYSALPQEIDTPSGEQTKVDVIVAGTYTASFSAEVSLMGNLPQQLTAKVTSIITELESQTFTQHPNADWGNQTLTAGNYRHIGAMGLSGILQLSGSSTDIFILYCIGALTTSASSSVSLTGGALAENVFWIVDGAFSMGTSSNFKGVIFGKAAMTLGSSSSLEGRMYCKQAVAASAMSAVSGGNIDTVSPNSSPFIDLGPLEFKMMYNSWGPITRTGSATTNNLALLTGLGTISGFGAPYDGTFDSGIVRPTIWVDFMLFNDGVMVPESMRCIQKPVSDCHCVSFNCDMVCGANVVVDARIRVRLTDTASTVKTRCLNMTKIEL